MARATAPGTAMEMVYCPHFPYTRSSTPAMPWPTPMQAVHSA